ncbi:sigma-54-dependent transcriptional regulator [Salipaludibacillus aurantiacus]|uniref:Two-component system, NtrC family, response regulator n=1 Tax=Salipaludibacillus aurantiacus TaxID=1601833 RepID=A0A1H9SD15_9BACI|nr:sigma-54 dependent transcriptional regulator [Salipaludibacillus aurantiacus]SER82902.1 two-component system, NtrC family, response regulator [Salipaludibacillus aurantiacus]
MSKSILLVEDNKKLHRLIRQTLEKEGYTVYGAHNGKEANQLMNDHWIDAAVLDILLPDTTGIKLLEAWKPLYPGIPLILSTAYGDVEDAVEAMKLGAFDYLTKPVKSEELKVVIERALRWQAMNEENRELKKEMQTKFQLHGMIGVSENMKQVFDMIQRVSKQDVTVLLQGESGTGKSHCAKAIHLESSRQHGPFISLNCAAIPANLLESELFGYVKGAFTGAADNRKGKVEAAEGGTLFLDEIGDMPLELQSKLLQVTQEKQFIPLGSSTTKEADVRLIAATNRNLWKLVQEGKFREDLYYRLNIIGIDLPPLQERKEDIPSLIYQLLSNFETEHRRAYSLSEETVKQLARYSWPGNIRELYNALARATVLSAGSELELKDFPKEIQEELNLSRPAAEKAYDHGNLNRDAESRSLPEQMEYFERNAIENALKEANGNQSKAAETLGISRQSLLYKVRKYDVDLEHI